MNSLNKKITLRLFLLIINVVCVVCTTRCEVEVFKEFKNTRPLDDFLHALFNIKADVVQWEAATNTNVQIYTGVSGRLNRFAEGYYFDMLETVQDMNLPKILSPQQFCDTEYPNESYECSEGLAAIGCRVVDAADGIACLLHMYTNWTPTHDPIMPGTESYSDKDLLKAICKGCSKFRRLNDEQLFQMFVSNPGYIEAVSDERLLEANTSRSIFNISAQINDARNSVLRSRFRKYGIPEVSYAALCEEYQRRKTAPKLFDNLYANYIKNRLKTKRWNSKRFKSRRDFCERFAPAQQQQ